MTEQRPKWLFDRRERNQGISRNLASGINAEVFIGSHSMLSIVKVEPWSQGTVHSHPEEQWGILLEGECVRIQDGVEVPVRAGDFWYTPGNVTHGIRTGGVGAVIVDFFSPPRAEYRKPGSGFGQSTES